MEFDINYIILLSLIWKWKNSNSDLKKYSFQNIKNGWRLYCVDQGSTHQSRLVLGPGGAVRCALKILGPHRTRTNKNRKISHQLATSGSRNKRCVDPWCRLPRSRRQTIPTKSTEITVLLMAENHFLWFFEIKAEDPRFWRSSVLKKIICSNRLFWPSDNFFHSLTLLGRLRQKIAWKAFCM